MTASNWGILNSPDLLDRAEEAVWQFYVETGLYFHSSSGFYLIRWLRPRVPRVTKTGAYRNRQEF